MYVMYMEMCVCVCGRERVWPSVCMYAAFHAHGAESSRHVAEEAFASFDERCVVCGGGGFGMGRDLLWVERVKKEPEQSLEEQKESGGDFI